MLPRAALSSAALLSSVVGLTLPVLAAAQAPASRSPATAEACTAIAVDAERLACYDTAMGRAADSAKMADESAQRASETKQAIAQYDRVEREALPPTAQVQRRFSELLQNDRNFPSLDARIANAGKGGMLDSRWELAKDSKLGLFSFRAYKPVYLLPAFWTRDPNELPQSANPDNSVNEPMSLSDVEAKFQISFKAKAAENLFGDNGDLWVGYTQSSRWQVYNGEDSRPFRETDYEPELLLVFRNNYRLGGWHGRLLGIGLNHQSNGRAEPMSRSWNRVIMNIGLDRDDWALMLRPWWRISDGNDDENPGIENFIGRGDATLVHRRGGHEFALMARHSLRGGENSRGAVQLDWGFPLNNTLRGHLQLFEGYGESLIDYNHRATYFGIGVSLLEWY